MATPEKRVRLQVLLLSSQCALLLHKNALSFPELPFHFPEVPFRFLKFTFCFPEVAFYFSKMPYCFPEFFFSMLNPLSAKFIKWSNTLKQIVGKLPTICLSVFDHFSGLALKGLKLLVFLITLKPLHGV